MQRWAIFLTDYRYKIQYLNSSENSNADALFRLPLPETKSLNNDLGHLFHIQEGLPITYKQIASETRKDPILNKIIGYCLHGWPDIKANSGIESNYFSKREQIHLQYGCLLWGYRVIIPTKLREFILNDLHDSHLGTNKMKSIARSYFWWPSLDSDIVNTCAKCNTCNTFKSNPPKTTVHPWPRPNKVWSRLHIDFLGPIYGSKFFVITDATSKWLEVFKMSRTTAADVISILRRLFSTFGIPETIVCDNGPPFTSYDFKNFLERNGVRLIFSPPYHPASNGAAEINVKTVKLTLKKAYKEGKDLDRALCQFLFDYRNSVHTTTQASPAKLMFGRSLRSKFDLLVPRTSEITENNIFKQTELDKHKERNFAVGDNVLTKDFTNSSWTPGTIINREGNVMYDVQAEENKIMRRHTNHLIPSPKIEKRRSCPLAAFTSSCSRQDTGESSSKETTFQESQIDFLTTSDSTVLLNRYNLRPRNKIN